MLTFGIGHGAGGASPFAALGKPGIGIIHGIAQGVVSKLRGGSFRAGFAAGLIGHMSPTLSITGDSAAAIIGRTLYAGLWGGLASMASGGKFEDGAFQAAMVHLFNNEGKADWDEKQKTWIYYDNDSQEAAARTSWNTRIKNAYSRVGEGISEYWYLNPGGAAVAAGIGGAGIKAVQGLAKTETARQLCILALLCNGAQVNINREIVVKSSNAHRKITENLEKAGYRGNIFKW